MGKSGGFYAVAVGRSTGVYTSWGDAEAQVKGFAGARYKKFPTQVQAEAFVVSQGRGSDSARPVPPVAVSSSGRKRECADLNASSESGDGTDGPISPPETKRLSTAPGGGPFYAVLEGRNTGIVSTWKEVVKHTEGYDRPAYRKFDSREAAEAFMRGYYEAKELPKQLVTVRTFDSPGTSDQGSVSSAGGGNIIYWYAVAKGRKTGVYDNWADAKTQIEGLFSAKFKKFPTKAEAEAFVRDHQESVQPQSGDPDPKHPDSLVAFCDGSALQNGRFGCQAGFACIFPHNPSWNVAKKLVEDRATNNRAEYLAALEAMKRANQEDVSQTRPLYIFSDSMLLIRSMTEWITGWQKKNWTKADGNPVLNRDLLELLLREKGSRRVIWRHVKAHTGRKDWHSKWNDVADHAARNAAAGWEPTSSA